MGEEWGKEKEESGLWISIGIGPFSSQRITLSIIIVTVILIAIVILILITLNDLVVVFNVECGDSSSIACEFIRFVAGIESSGWTESERTLERYCRDSGIQ